MENNINFYSWLSLRLPLILLFANGYFIYRLFVITKLTDVFVFRSLQRSHGNIKHLCLYIIAAATLLSFFIPNAVTVLILLPILKTIDQDIALQAGNKHRITTALTLSTIYGANIGGMGSLIGSPANLLMIGALDLYEVPGREQIGFFNWFIWSVPLVALFTAAAWILVATLAVPEESRKITFTLKGMEDHNTLSTEQRSGLSVFVLFLSFWIIESVLKEFMPGFDSLDLPACVCFFILFLCLVFVRRFGVSGKPLLRPKHIFTGFPGRGILFLCLLAVIIAAVRFFQIDRLVSDVFSSVIRPDTPSFVIIILTIMTVIFLTEFLSNTLVSTAFFSIAYFISTAHNIPPLILMIAVSIASTCAFMTPVATPCNALAFGEMKGTSFRMMLVLGFLLNIIGAFLMSIWLQLVIPFIYH